MPSRKTTKAALAAVAAMPPIPKDIIDLPGVNYPELSATTIVSGAVGR